MPYWMADLFILFFCLQTAAQAAQWEHIPIAAGKPPFVAVAVNPESALPVVAADSRAIHASIDSGVGWHEAFTSPAAVAITALATNHGATWLAATDQGLYGTFDGGSHWSLIFRASGEDKSFCTAAAFDPSNPNRAALGTRGGLFLSADGGHHWLPATGLTDSGPVIHLAFDAHARERLYLLAQGGLFVGDLNDNTWKKLDSTLKESEDKPAKPEEPEEAAVDSPSFQLIALSLHPAQPSHVYLGTSRGVRASVDGGQTWQWLSNTGLRSARIRRLVWLMQPSPTLYAATARGIARYSALSESWQMLTAGLSDGAIYDLAAHANELWAAADAGVFRYQATDEPFTEEKLSDPRELLGNFVYEPAIGPVREAAIRYAEVHPDKIKNWRRQAALRALLPNVNFGIDHGTSQNIHVDEGTFPNFQVLSTKDRDSGLDVSVTWQLGDLIWSDDQTAIDTRSKLMVQLRDDIVNEVTRTYYERRRLQIALLMAPPKDDHTLLEKELRVQELTALIDGLTGGYFSANATTPTNHGRM